MTSLERQLAELSSHAAALAKQLEGDERELTQAIAYDLAVVLPGYMQQPAVERALSVLLADLEALAQLKRALPGRRVSDAAILAAVQAHSGGIRAAARALQVAPSIVSRRVKVLLATPERLPAPEAARRVAGVGVMERERGDDAPEFVCSPTRRSREPASTPGDDTTMFGNGNGKEPERVRLEVSSEMLLERLRTSPTIAAEFAADEVQQVRMRQRLHDEIAELERTLEKRTAPVRRALQAAAARVDELSRALDEARAHWAAAQMDFDAIQVGTEHACSRFARELERTADPQIAEFLSWCEHETTATRCHSPPFNMHIPSEAESLEHARKGLVGRPPAGSYDQHIHEQLGARLNALREAHARARALKREPLTKDQVVIALERFRLQIPAIPQGASLVVPLPRTVELRARP
jgi:hypothetical protein